MYCPNCGAKNDSDAKYCKNCGLSLKNLSHILNENRESTKAKEQANNIQNALVTNDSPVRDCPKCGETNFSYKSKCDKCGYSFISENDANSHSNNNDYEKKADKEKQKNSINETVKENHILESNGILFNDTKPKNVKDKIEKYDSIGGFLILIGIGLLISPIVILVGTFDSFKVITSEYFSIFSPNLKVFLYFGITSAICLVVILIFLNALFYQKISTFPKYMIGFYILNILISIIYVYWYNNLGLEKIEGMSQLSQEMSTEVIKSIVFACVWIPYLLISKRVKNTFVN